ncbi:MAG: N-acetyltransferase [Bacteroidales bacterium]
MALSIIEVTNKKQLKDFVNFPFMLYKNDDNWIPPLKSDELNAIRLDNNIFRQFCDFNCWLAISEGEVVGRIMTIINKEYNNTHNSQQGRFSRIEFINDLKVSELLINTAIKWLRSKGCNQIVGPLGFTNFDNQGLLIEGFDFLPSIASVYHKHYYQEHFEKLNFNKDKDWIEFRLTIPNPVDPKIIRVKEIICKRKELSVISFKSNKDLLKYKTKIFNILNEAFNELYSFATLSPELIDYYAEKYFGFINPEFVKVITDKNDEVLGFIIGLPSMSKAMKKANGKLFPFGFYHLTNAQKKNDTMDILLTAVRPDQQGLGLPALLIAELQQTMIDYNIFEAETTGMLEDNHQAIQHWKHYENIQHKRRRSYVKNI